MRFVALGYGLAFHWLLRLLICGCFMGWGDLVLCLVLGWGMVVYRVGWGSFLRKINIFFNKTLTI